MLTGFRSLLVVSGHQLQRERRSEAKPKIGKPHACVRAWQ